MFGRHALALLSLLTLVAAGCIFAGAAAVGAGIVYVGGEGKKTFMCSVDDAHAATLKTLDQKGLIKLGESRDGEGWMVRTRRLGDAAEVKIRIHRAGESLTEVAVRVGTWGDKDYSAQMLEAIESNM